MINRIIEWLLQNVEAVASILSASATVALAILYRRQGKILDAQKDIQRAEQVPEIDLVDRTFDGDSLEVTVSNYGSGVAKNIRFCAAIAAPLDDQIEPTLTESRARRVREGGQQTLEQAMNPHESEVRFRGTPYVGFYLEGIDHPCGDFSTAFDTLRQQNPELISFQIYVVVDDQLGGCQYKRLFGFPPTPINTPPKDAPNDAQGTSDLPAHPSLETLWEHSGVSYTGNPNPDFIEPNCRN